MPVLNARALVDQRVEAIRRFHAQVGTNRAELDVSGGVDSATLLGLLARALGPENVAAVYSSIHSSDESRARAKTAAAAFGVPLLEVALEEAFESARREVVRALAATGVDRAEIEARVSTDPTILGSFRSCLRAPVGRFVNRLTGGGIRHGTGNECEDRWLRFYQKGGDGEVDTNPIAMLSKGEVFQLGVALGVPAEIIAAQPTPDLWGVGDNHNDEDELKAISGVDWTYSQVDPNTGAYTKVGTIERLSRALDLGFEGAPLADVLFGADEVEPRLPALVAAAQSVFPGFESPTIREFVLNARKWERVTRHKLNPNCPSLGVRAELLNAGILTDELPDLRKDGGP
jgi:NAD+ synthetase